MLRRAAHPSRQPTLLEYERSGGVLGTLKAARPPIPTISREPEAAFASRPKPSFLEGDWYVRTHLAKQHQAFLRGIWGSNVPQDRPYLLIHKSRKLVDWLSDSAVAILVSAVSERSPSNRNPVSSSLSLQRAMLNMAVIKSTHQDRECIVLALIDADTPLELGEQSEWEAARLGVQLYLVTSGEEAAEIVRGIESEREADLFLVDEVPDPTDESWARAASSAGD
jgi:hypothetical protein